MVGSMREGLLLRKLEEEDVFSCAGRQVTGKTCIGVFGGIKYGLSFLGFVLSTLRIGQESSKSFHCRLNGFLTVQSFF